MLTKMYVAISCNSGISSLRKRSLRTLLHFVEQSFFHNASLKSHTTLNSKFVNDKNQMKLRVWHDFSETKMRLEKISQQIEIVTKKNL